jgi:predicted nuclease of predicted toxin-antitoxin system
VLNTVFPVEDEKGDLSTFKLKQPKNIIEYLAPKPAIDFPSSINLRYLAPKPAIDFPSSINLRYLAPKPAIDFPSNINPSACVTKLLSIINPGYPARKLVNKPPLITGFGIYPFKLKSQPLQKYRSCISNIKTCSRPASEKTVSTSEYPNASKATIFLESDTLRLDFRPLSNPRLCKFNFEDVDPNRNEVKVASIKRFFKPDVVIDENEGKDKNSKNLLKEDEKDTNGEIILENIVEEHKEENNNGKVDNENLKNLSSILKNPSRNLNNKKKRQENVKVSLKDFVQNQTPKINLLPRRITQKKILVSKIKRLKKRKTKSSMSTNEEEENMSEVRLYGGFVNNLNMVFAKYSVPFEAADTHKILNMEGNMPDITVFVAGTEHPIFYVEVKNDINDKFTNSAGQVIGYAKDILQHYANRHFSICVLSCPNYYTVFCAYRYKEQILTSQLLDATQFKWKDSDEGCRGLLKLLLTDFNWYGHLCVPSRLNERFLNAGFLTSYSISNANSSSHHFVSMISFLLVLLYFYAMKTKCRFTLTNSWNTCFSNTNTEDVKENEPKDLLKFEKKSWNEVLPVVLKEIMVYPQKWTSFMDGVCGCKNIRTSWPDAVKENPDYVSGFDNFCQGDLLNSFYKAFSKHPINAFKNTTLFLNEGVPMLPSYYCFEIDPGVSLVTDLCKLISSNFGKSLFFLQFEDIFSTPFKFFSFLTKYSDWESVFSNFDFFSLNHLSFNKIERQRFLGAGLSGEVLEYSDPVLDESYAVKFFYSNRVVEFKREVSAYLTVEGVVPTLEMVSFDPSQQILVLSPVASRLYKGGDRPKLEYFEDLVDDLSKLHTLGLVHRDIRPDNLIYILIGELERLVLIDWSSSVYEDMKVPFEGTVRYASDDVLHQLIRNETEIVYTHKDDMCSLVKVFLGRFLCLETQLSNIKEDSISILSSKVLEIWKEVIYNNPWVNEFFKAAKEMDYILLKIFMREIYYPSFNKVFIFNKKDLFLFYSLYYLFHTIRYH